MMKSGTRYINATRVVGHNLCFELRERDVLVQVKDSNAESGPTLAKLRPRGVCTTQYGGRKRIPSTARGALIRVQLHPWIVLHPRML